MNAKDLLQLTDSFFRSSWDIADIVHSLGTPIQSNLSQVALAPLDPNIDAVLLEQHESDVSYKPLIVGIIMYFKRAIDVDLGNWSALYGPYSIMPRLKPAQPIPYRYLIQGHDVSGYVLLNAVDVATNMRLKVVSVIFRRHPLVSGI